MKTKTYNVYKYDELTTEQKQKAIENLQGINTEYFDWYEYTIQDEKENLQKAGFEDSDISFSGFCCQGDGASFTATIDTIKLVPTNLQKYIDTITITKSSYNSEHEYTMQINIDYTDEPTDTDTDQQLGNLENEILEKSRDKARAIYKRLETEYNYLNSDESIIETIQANDYDFTSNGVID